MDFKTENFIDILSFYLQNPRPAGRNGGPTTVSPVRIVFLFHR